jgi:hypothetical protein
MTIGSNTKLRPAPRDSDGLRHEIEPARVRDKIPHLHRAIAPLGTDDEASASHHGPRLGPDARLSPAMVGYALFVLLFGIFFWSALIR